MTQEQSPLILVVKTDEGTFVREVADALPLAAGVERGLAAEEATRSAVARWGLPDFVFRPVLRRVGSGVRELGDVVLVHHRRGVVVQVKSRKAATSDDERERAWLKKAIATASRQAAGTVRSMRSSDAVLQNLRGRQITVNGDHLQWVAVVVVDHPSAPTRYTPELSNSKLPVVVLLRRDWEFLFEQLRSAHAVVGYIERVAAREAVPLDEEPARYYELAAADAVADPEPLDPRIVSDGTHYSAPLLPRAPVGSDDHNAHLLVRMILEDIAATPMDDSVDERHRIEVLAAIDTLPVSIRTELGRFLIEILRDVVTVEEDGIKWRFRRFRHKPGTPHLLFGACSMFSELTREAFRQWVMLRHHEFSIALGSSKGLMSVGVLLTPRHDGLRPWDTTIYAVDGDLDLTPEEVRSMAKVWS